MIKELSIATLLGLMIFATSSLAQNEGNENGVDQKMEAAKDHMLDGEYEKANLVFRQILSTEKVLPTNLSYLFAETLYQIGQYQNSQNFLEKYLKLEGKGGDYAKEASHLGALLTNKFGNIESCQYCDIRGYRLNTCTLCSAHGHIEATCHYCKGLGIISCQQCHGEGVVIETNVFGHQEYQSCQRCSTLGTHKCPVCEGLKAIDITCPECLGSGNQSSKNICDHKPTSLGDL